MYAEGASVVEKRRVYTGCQIDILQQGCISLVENSFMNTVGAKEVLTQENCAFEINNIL